ncbi:MAG: PMT2 domain-containing protein [Nitrospira sp.]|nr:MAG: PMT2 domain-containing protein [Nitrospira sp.]
MPIATHHPLTPDDDDHDLPREVGSAVSEVRPIDRSLVERLDSASWIPDVVVVGLLLLIVFGSGLIHIESFPPLFFDEGWTVCVARTWVEIGHYGCLLRGEPAPPSLAAHFPVVASVAASFTLFGVGVWQTRLVGLLYTFGAFLLLYLLTRRLYGRSVAIAALTLLMLVPLKWSIHPLYIGRQVLGEMPLLCFLLAGFVCFLRSRQRPLWLVAAIVCWALALMTKAQVAPFFIASFAGTMVLLGLRRNWSAVGGLGIAMIGSWGGFRFFIEAKGWLLNGHTMSHPPIDGMTEAIALVFVPAIRLETIQLLFVSWAEYPLGLAYAAWRLRRTSGSHDRASLEGTTQTMLVLLAGSWLAWFAFLSAGEPRYALPGLFLAAPFTAVLFHDATRGFNVAFVSSTLAGLVQRRRVTSEGLKAVVVVVLLAMMGWVAVQERYAFRAREDDRDLFEVTQYLNTSTPATALIETYDSELFLFLQRPYTYALPRILVEIIRREQGHTQAVTYDPLQGRPDYLVVGEYGRWAGFYKPLIAQNRVRLVTTIGRYQIYEPVRS